MVAVGGQTPPVDAVSGGGVGPALVLQKWRSVLKSFRSASMTAVLVVVHLDVVSLA